jgi:cellulose synthase (UDP-forming)
MAKLLYGWAHVFALWDICRGRRMGWQPTGGSKRKSKTRRMWVGISLWNGSTGIIWVLLALWRMPRYGVANFAFILLTGLVAASVSGMALLSRWNHARVYRES